MASYVKLHEEGGGAKARRRSPSLRESRIALRRRLDSRRAEIEQTTITRVYAVSNPTEVQDPGYVQGLRAALKGAIDYALTVIELGEAHAPAIPPSLLTQARTAARNGVGLDTVLRRYVAGYSVLSEFVIQEAEDTDLLRGASLKLILRGQAAVLDRLVAAVSDEHTREANGRLSSNDERRAERVARLLAGELIDTSELAYDFDAHHLAAVAHGPGAREALHDIAASLDARLLWVRHEDSTFWAWFGSRREIEIEKLPASALPPQLALTLGEPAHGLPGWRFSHRQAEAALPIALRSCGCIVRYADVALLASILNDDLLVASLQQLYLAPLEDERDGGRALRETLRAYFAADRNVSSAAMRLGIDRKTAAMRLRGIEERLGRSPLGACAAELEIALRLDEMTKIDAEAPRMSTAR